MNVRILVYCLAGMWIWALCGCISPLRSMDPATRLAAVSQIKDERDLLFIAFNVKVTGDTTWRAEDFADDVREAAVKRLDSISLLLQCAILQDGEPYQYIDGRNRLRMIVNPGDTVRNAAKVRLSEPSCFSRLCQFLKRQDDALTAKAFQDPFYASRQSVSNSQDEILSGIISSGKLDAVLADIIAAKSDQSQLCAFVVAAKGKEIAYHCIGAVNLAFDRIDGSDQASCRNMFNELVQGAQNSTRRIMLAWNAFGKLEKPTVDQCRLVAALGYGGPGNEAEVNAIAGRQFPDLAWKSVYIAGEFKDFPSRRKLENIKSEAVLADLLMEAKSMSSNDAAYAVGRIGDAELVEKIKLGCCAKEVAEAAKVRHFRLTYRQQMSNFGGVSDSIDKAFAVLEFKRQLAASDLEDGLKLNIAKEIGRWMVSGANAVLAESERHTNENLVVGGFYVGMPECWAQVLKEGKYPKSNVLWTVDDENNVDWLEFDSAFLAKVFRFEAYTWQEWIRSFSEKTGRTFREDLLQKEKKPVGGKGVTVKVQQKIWRHYDGKANIAITFYGDKKVEEIEPELSFAEGLVKMVVGDSIVSTVVKEGMLEGARDWANNEWEKVYGAVPGVMRIEMGGIGPGGSKRGPYGDKKDASNSEIESVGNSLKDSFKALQNLFE